MHTPKWMLGLVLLALVLGAVALPGDASAHAAYKSSDPANGAIVAAMPGTISASFTERLEFSESWLKLYDRTGTEVTGTTLSQGSDDYTMVLTVPAGLANGTYSVLWHSFSNDDGHTASGYFTFTVGTAADVSSAVTIPTLKSGEGAPQIWKTLSRWAALLGLAALIAIWPMWVTIVRPALGPVWHDGPRLTRRMKRYAQIAFALAVLGSIFALAIQAISLTEGTWFDKVMNTLGQTRYGSLWLTRVGLFAALGLMLSACAWWFLKQRRFEHIAAWVLTLALPIPFSLNAHASAQPAGRMTAVVADYAHLLAAGIWIGGLGVLAFVLLPGVRSLIPDGRSHRQVLMIAIPRFSLLGIVAWLVLGITGFYAGWLQVGNLHALTTTPYGKALLVKLALLVVVLAIAAVNLLVISRHLQKRIDADAATLWGRRLAWTVAAELVLVIGVLVAVGQMTSLEPARDVVVARGQQITVHYTDANPPATLLIAPGSAGVNHFRLEIDAKESLPTETTALLRLTLPENAGLGTKEITLARVAGNAFEYHGSDLGITGQWQVQMILRLPDAAQVEATQTVTIAETPPQEDVPGTPWRFETLGGVSGLLLLLAGLGALAYAVMEARGRTRKELAGLGIAAVVMGIVLLLQARIDPILAVSANQGAIDPGNLAMVERGSAVYTTYCLSCHGADLRGDGPQSAGMTPPPADFAQPHTMVHSESDLVYWLTNGKQGTAMPGFRDSLSDQQIRDVLAFIAYRQSLFDEARPVATP